MSDSSFLEKLDSKIDKMPKIVRYPVRAMQYAIILGIFLIMIAIVQNLYDFVGKTAANIFSSIF